MEANIFNIDINDRKGHYGRLSWNKEETSPLGLVWANGIEHPFRIKGEEHVIGARRKIVEGMRCLNM